MKIANFDPTYADALAGAIAVIVSNITMTASPWKMPVRVATTGAGTITADYIAGATVDGITLVLDDRILIRNQTVGTENGIYIVGATGAPTRSGDFNDGAAVTGAIIPVVGTTNGGAVWVNTNSASITLATTALTFVALGSAILSGGFSGSFGAGILHNIEALGDIQLGLPEL